MLTIRIRNYSLAKPLFRNSAVHSLGEPFVLPGRFFSKSFAVLDPVSQGDGHGRSLSLIGVKGGLDDIIDDQFGGLLK
ncbi:MAG: hypothetical protein PVJ53_08075 [Desulfobacterales bacterium]|jgi:hypothetical protein